MKGFFWLLLWLVLLGLLGHCVGQLSIFKGHCPEPECECRLDERGRMEVSCTLGRMHSVPTSRIHESTEVIQIVAPKNQPNHLTLGRYFTQFKKLEELHIVNSNIPNIGENSFWGMVSLRALNLTGNNVTNIMEVNFKGLSGCENLSLAQNSIETVVSASFKGMGKLKLLDLSKNRITKLVERLFFNLHHLEVLDLSENWIRELSPDVFRDIWKLKVLRCRSCGLNAINPNLYNNLPELRKLDLGANEFKHLKAEEFVSLIHLEELYLDGNQIAVIDDETFRNAHLRRLSLASNRIYKFGTRSFFNATVSALDLSGNKFDSLDKTMFSHLRRNLTAIDLSRSPKLKFSPLLLVLGANPQLTWLSLAENSYDEFPLELFAPVKSLEFLNLSGNVLADLFPPQFTMLHNLRTLDLSRNRLKGLDGELLDFFDRTNVSPNLYLTGNPWACDKCNIPHFLRWLQTSQQWIKGCHDPNGPFCIRCSSPYQFMNKSIVSVDEDILEWCNTIIDPEQSILADDPRLGLFIGCALLVIILILAATAVIYHSRWHAAHYYTHEESRPEIGTPPLPPEYDDSSDGFDNLYFTKESCGKARMIATIEEMAFVDHSVYHPTQSLLPNANGGKNGHGHQIPSSSPKIPMLQNCHR